MSKTKLIAVLGILVIGAAIGTGLGNYCWDDPDIESLKSDVALLKQRVDIKRVECALCGRMAWKDEVEQVWAERGFLLCPSCYQGLQWEFAEKETTWRYWHMGEDTIPCWYVVPKNLDQ